MFHLEVGKTLNLREPLASTSPEIKQHTTHRSLPHIVTLSKASASLPIPHGRLSVSHVNANHWLPTSTLLGTEQVSSQEGLTPRSSSEQSCLSRVPEGFWSLVCKTCEEKHWI